MPDIQVVTFDLWQTLLIDHQEWGLERARLRVEGAVEALHASGQQVNPEEVQRAYRACYLACRVIHQQGRDVSFREQVQIFVRGIQEGLLERISRETFARILNRYADAFFESPPALADGTSNMLQALTERGYRLGVISNTSRTPGRLMRAYLDHLNILRYFHHLTFSDEVLLSKPAPAIFLHTLASIGCAAEHTVHVGDHRRNDILGAQGVGIRTVLVEEFAQGEAAVSPTLAIRHVAELPQALERLTGH